MKKHKAEIEKLDLTQETEKKHERKRLITEQEREYKKFKLDLKTDLKIMKVEVSLFSIFICLFIYNNGYIFYTLLSIYIQFINYIYIIKFILLIRFLLEILKFSEYILLLILYLH